MDSTHSEGLGPPLSEKEIALKVFDKGEEFLKNAKRKRWKYYFELRKYSSILPKECVIETGESRVQIVHWDFPRTKSVDGKTITFHIRPRPSADIAGSGQELDIQVVSYTVSRDRKQGFLAESGAARLERMQLVDGKKYNLPGSATVFGDNTVMRELRNNPGFVAFANFFLGVNSAQPIDILAKNKVANLLYEARLVPISRYDIGFDDVPDNFTSYPLLPTINP